MGSVSGVPKPARIDDGLRRLPPDETVGAASATLKPLTGRVESRFSFPSGAHPDVLFTIEADSEVSVFVFNTIADRDPDLVLLPAGAASPLRRTAEDCWLKVRHEAAVRATGGATLAGLGFRFEAEAPLIFNDYRRHDRSETVVHAVATDLKRPRFAQRLADVRALRPNEALSFQASGKLCTTVEVGWSDVLASGLGALAGIVGALGPLSVEVSAAATVEAAVTVADDFLIVFARDHEGTTRVVVAKAVSRRLACDGGVSMTVELSDPQQLQQALEDATAGLLGQEYATVRRVVDAAALSDLTDRERAAAEELARRLGLGDLVNEFTILREKLLQLEGVLAEAVAELATAKLTAGFAYEYDRIAQGSTLLQAVLEPEALAAHHRTLCGGELGPVIAALRNGCPGLVLERYLHRESLARTQSWGFTLAIGPWMASGKQRRILSRVVQEDLAGRPRVSTLGLGAYEGRWLCDVAEWVVDFNAAMPAFAAGPAPLVNEFKLGLHLTWNWKEANLAADELDAYLDAATLWRVFEPAEAAEIRQRLEPAVGRPAGVAVQLQVDDVSLRSILPLAATGRDADFAAALGAAMPWRAGSPGRAEPEHRRELYGALWGYFLDNPDVPARTLVEYARRYLSSRHEPELGFLEESYSKLVPTCTFVGLAKLANQGTAAAWKDFRSGAALLHEALSAGEQEGDTFNKAFSLMVNLWAQSHHVRALGAYLLELATAARIAHCVARTLTVTYREGDGERALVVAAPAT
jgi:hypothetical protein